MYSIGACNLKATIKFLYQRTNKNKYKKNKSQNCVDTVVIQASMNGQAESRKRLKYNQPQKAIYESFAVENLFSRVP